MVYVGKLKGDYLKALTKLYMLALYSERRFEFVCNMQTGDILLVSWDRLPRSVYSYVDILCKKKLSTPVELYTYLGQGDTRDLPADPVCLSHLVDEMPVIAVVEGQHAIQCYTNKDLYNVLTRILSCDKDVQRLHSLEYCNVEI